MPSREESQPRFFERQELLNKRLAFIVASVDDEVPENFGEIASPELRHLYDDFWLEASIIHSNLEAGDLDRVVEGSMELLQRKAEYLIKVMREALADKKA